MQGARYFVISLQVLYVSEASAAHCPQDLNIPVVYMCLNGEQSGRKVYIDAQSAVQFLGVKEASCRCDVTLNNNPSTNLIWVSTPGYKDCGSRLVVQLHSGTETSRYGCEENTGAFTYFWPNFAVTFETMGPDFSSEYCLRVEPDFNIPSSNATAFVKCYSNAGSSSTSTVTPTELSTKTTAIVTTESSKMSTNSWTTLTTNALERSTDDGDKQAVNIVAIAVGAGVGAVVVIAIVVAVSLFLCRRMKGKTSSKPKNINESVEMTDNALYNMPLGDDHVNANGKSSTLEIRHIEVEGGDIYALPSKPNTTSQSQNRSTLQEEYSEPLGAEPGEKSPETEKDEKHKEHINPSFVSENGTKRETVKSNYYAEPEDGIKNPQTETGMDSTYAEIC